MEILELYLPAPRSRVTQGWNQNANDFYKDNGLPGHTSFDWDFGHGEDVPNCAADAYCYSVLNRDNPDPMKYRGVYTLVNAKNGLSDWAEVSYGHADKILAEVGKIYQPGDILLTAGNTGDVYSGGRYVTKEEKLRGSTAGTHLHGPQVRPVKPVKKTSRNKEYLYDGFGIFKKDGYYFEIVDYYNGVNGCVDPDLYFNEIQALGPKQFVFTKDLYLGITDPEVRALQRFLNKEGFTVSLFGNGSKGRETDYFGYLTYSALVRFQKARGISPARGYFGPITRGYINTV